MTKNSVMIREYQDRDKKECRALWWELTEHHREIYNDASFGGADPGRFFDDHLERVGPHRVWVAEQNRIIVGMIGLLDGDTGAEIEPLVVKHEYRRQGIGKKLLQFVIQEAKSLGLKDLSIKPVVRNIDAIKAFYLLGFQNLGHIELFIDLKPEKRREWKSNLNLFGLDFNY